MCLIGGAGDDLLTGGKGRNLMIGGLGSDRLVGNANDDILISGFTAYDDNEVALQAILDEWTSARTYAERTANLLGSGAGSSFASRLNGDFFLKSDDTVYDDNAKDTLTGCSGRDWFFANVSLNGDDATRKDEITDLSASEFAEDLDFIYSDL